MKRKELVVTLSNVKKITGLHFTVNHSGKMAGMMSLSTSTYCNSDCVKNAAVKGSICEKCYARKQMAYMTSMNDPLENNFDILNKSIIDPELLPIINALYFRFEAFGDLASENQVINYFNICKKNPLVKFALWTKNPRHIKKAIEDGHKKPSNLQIVYSGLFIDKPVTLEKIQTVHPYIDKVFNVFTEKHAIENNIKINCGARSCFKCHKCYIKSKQNEICELLK